jgi:N6-adenosine-specific RNA methylase IME4
MSSPSILFQNADKTVTLLDIPCSIELAQSFGDHAHASWKLISSAPLQTPWVDTSPKSVKGLEAIGPPEIGDMLIQKHLQFALEEVKATGRREWCSIRALHKSAPRLEKEAKKRKLEDFEVKEGISHQVAREGIERIAQDFRPSHEASLTEHLEVTKSFHPKQFFYQNDFPSTRKVIFPIVSKEPSLLPPNSSFILGNFGQIPHRLMGKCPAFDIVIMDPPWPNRSARRTGRYVLADRFDIDNLLLALPFPDHLAEKGLMGVWITNKPAFRDMLLKENGVFDAWDVELCEEWVWLKITSTGEPICNLEARTRKPYEILLVARKKSLDKYGLRDNEEVKNSDIKRRVIIGVPDLHSRKPNLKELFESADLGLQEGYKGCEMFARNLTAGWYAIGNEVLKFQGEESWTDGPEEDICIEPLKAVNE